MGSRVIHIEAKGIWSQDQDPPGSLSGKSLPSLAHLFHLLAIPWARVVGGCPLSPPGCASPSIWAAFLAVLSCHHVLPHLRLPWLPVPEAFPCQVCSPATPPPSHWASVVSLSISTISTVLRKTRSFVWEGDIILHPVTRNPGCLLPTLTPCCQRSDLPPPRPCSSIPSWLFSAAVLPLRASRKLFLLTP